MVGRSTPRSVDRVATIAAAMSADFQNAVDLSVLSRPELMARGCSAAELEAQLAARRWQRVGRAVVLHNGPLDTYERWHAARVNCGPRAVLTSFTALELLGLEGWKRAEIHVLAPAGVPKPRGTGLPIVLHRSVLFVDDLEALRAHRLAPAAVIAASSFRTARPAVGLLAATVQQRLVSAAQLRDAIVAAPRTRHRALLLSAVDDIAMGSDALSEIDFVALCRRHGLPLPTQQAVRVDSRGKRRYLDAEWILPSGRRVAAEVDGAIHLVPQRWFDDQLRQNEITLSGTVVLRFPSVVIRTEPELVAAQLRRALGISRS
jgi:hypothetical protein